MTRSNPGEFHAFDPEIDRTLHSRLRLNRTNSAPVQHIDIDFASVHFDSDNSDHTTTMANNQERTLKELAAPDVNYQSLCIQYPDVDAPFELRSGLIHLLPKFHGLAGEDPNKHLKEFHIVCSTMRPQGILEEHIKLRAFPFSLQDAAKD